jgi:hypothetical protein
MWPGNSRRRQPEMKFKAANALIIAFLGVALYAGFAGRDIYPFSSFPMYSAVRADPQRGRYYDLLGVTADGRVTREVTAPLGTAVFVDWVRDGQGDRRRIGRLGRALLSYNRRRTPELVAIRIVRVTYEISAYPNRDRPRKRRVEVLREVR